MSGTGAGGQTHPQPPTAPIVTLGPTTPKSDKSLEFIKPGSEEAAAINRVLLKEVEKIKYKPKQIVTAMKRDGYQNFTMQNHIDLWRSLSPKDPKKGYGVEILGGQWCWYETWLNRVREHCQENADRYK
jgi:hypothetical protein